MNSGSLAGQRASGLAGNGAEDLELGTAGMPNWDRQVLVALIVEKDNRIQNNSENDGLKSINSTPGSKAYSSF